MVIKKGIIILALLVLSVHRYLLAGLCASGWRALPAKAMDAEDIQDSCGYSV